MPRSPLLEIRDRIRLLASVDHGRRVFGASSHDYRLAPPLSDVELAALERRLGAVPQEYRGFLETVGAYGAGPYHGLIPPGQPAPAGAPLFEDAITLADNGSGGRALLVLRGPKAGEIWMDWTPERGGLVREAPGPDLLVEGDLAFLRRLNMPAILEFRSSGKQPHSYLGLTAIDGAKFLLKTAAGDRAIESDAGELDRNWNGVAYLPWKNFLSLSGTIPGNAPADSVLALKMLLRDLGHTGIPLSKEYDAATQKTVEQIQAKYGVPVDGVVGNLTKIIPYREGRSFDIPRLVSN